MVPSFLSLENLFSDSYTFIRTLTRLTIYMYYSRLLVYDIVNLVTLSLLNVLVTIIQFVLESKMISNDQELIQSDPTSCHQNQKGNN